jgi:alcohol dehydrogenase class IV
VARSRRADDGRAEDARGLSRAFLNLPGRFELALPGRILFGSGSVAGAGPAAAAFLASQGNGSSPGAKALLVYGGDDFRIASLLSSLDKAGVERVGFSIRREPRFEDARAALALARAEGCAIAIGCGGGSAIDLAKAVATLLANGGDPLDYAEVIGAGKPLREPSLPCIAIPTTAGTGSEATRNAVLSGDGVKVSLRSPTMLPSLAIVDPELCSGLPPRATADTGMDALTQLIEPFVCSVPNPFVDALCMEALPRAIRALPRAYRDGKDAEARQDMSFASLSGGIALANAKLGAVHGLAGPLGGAFPIPHGAACAALLPSVCEVNIRVLRERFPESPVLGRYSQLARLLAASTKAAAEDLVPALRELCAGLDIRPLKAFGIVPEAFSSLAAKALASSSMQGNPVSLLASELEEILGAIG